MYLLREILKCLHICKIRKKNQISKIRHYSLKNKAFQSYYSHSCFRSRHFAPLYPASMMNLLQFVERLVNKLSDEAAIETFFCKLTRFTTSE